MSDLQTTMQRLQAAASGWQLCHVYCMQAKRWLVQVLPVGDTFPHAPAAQAFVIGRARMNSPLEIDALSKVMAGVQPVKKKKK